MVKSDLDRWSDIIRQQSEARYQREDEQTQQMLKDLPARIAEISDKPNAELLDWWNHFAVLSCGYMTPRKQTAVFRLMRKLCRKEVLYRMLSGSPHW